MKEPKEEIVIDFQKVDETFLIAMGARLRMILDALFTGEYFPVSVRGSESQVDSFVRALAGEKRYLSSLSQYGLDNPKTLRDKYKLKKSVSSFERDTGLIWPFK
tara:strand:+ start:909 stop:1220 length:312 start_codon:yes stop_codon:yes gene_type:complete